MSITPITPGASTPVPSTALSSGSFTTFSSTGLDNQSSYSADLASGKALSIVGFSSIILTNTNLANETAWQVQQKSANSRNDLYNGSIQNSLDLMALYRTFLDVASQYTTAYGNNLTDISTLNTQLITYTSTIPSVQAAINQLNAAITSFNTGSITSTQLQTAIDQYNTFAQQQNGVVSQTNNAIDHFNVLTDANDATISHANQELLNAGKKPLATQPDYNTTATPLPIVGAAPGTPPMAPIVYSSVPLPLAVNKMDSKGAGTPVELANALFESYFGLMTGQFAITAEMLKQQSSFVSFVQFFLQGKLPFIPSAFYTPNNATTSTGTADTGSVSSTTLVTSLSTPTIEGILSQSKYLAGVTQEEYAKNFPQVTQQINYLLTTLLSQIGLQAGSSSLRLLEGRLPFIDPNSSPVLASLAGAFAEQTGQAIENGSLLPGITDILSKAFPGIDAQSLNSLAEKLASAADLVLLQTGLFQLGQALGNPQLVGQVVSTIPGATGSQTTASSQVDAEAVLNDKKFAAIVNDEISQQLATEANISQSQAQDALNASLNASIVDGNLNQQSFVDNLQQQGITSQAAIDATNLLHNTLQSEIINQGILNEAVSKNNLSKTILANDQVSQIVGGNPNITNRELRDELANQFIANGATSQQALTAATLAVTGNYAAIGTSPATVDSVSKNLYAGAIKQIEGIGLSQTAAEQFANDLVSTVMGPSVPGSQTSIRDLISQKLDQVLSTDDKTATEKVKESFRQYMEPTLELYAFAERLRDPGTTFLHVAQTGIMNSHSQPSNYVKNIDIPV